jgi:beta-galactosidase
MLDSGKFYVGTNYHPHDWSPKRWEKDIGLMKEAGFNVIRAAHLAWDSIEPADGQFSFAWLDTVMDLCQKNDIGVLLDIPTRPAPVWLHKKHRDIDITNVDRIRVDSHTRYMEDVGNPHFQKHALRLAETMATRYAKHSALLAFCLCNELGAGFISYSPEVELRFQKWLRSKYQTVKRLNAAWNGQRWSRKVADFSDVVLPENRNIQGSPERYLDMRRFYSDEIVAYLSALRDCVKRCAPDIPLSTNHWSENDSVGFDWHLAAALTDYPGIGFYPGTNPEYANGIAGACMLMDHRIGESENPIWCLEFQTGTTGGYGCPENVMRMYAYLALACCSQIICAWTWRSMLGGEEQYLFGLLDHDGTPSRKYREFARIANEFKELGRYLLPLREVKPEVAIAYSFESRIVSRYSKNFYKTDYTEHVLEAYKSLFYRNIPCNLIDLRNTIQRYKVLIVPGYCVMDGKSAETIRKMVEDGATVIMTAYSAKVDANNHVFDCYQPGGLSDIFGIRVAGFDRVRAHIPTVNEGGIEKKQIEFTRNYIGLSLNHKALEIAVDYYEYMELLSATPVGSYTMGGKEFAPAISSNKHGKGKAIYIGVPASEALIGACLDYLGDEIPLNRNRSIPYGVITRETGDGLALYVNTTGEEKTVPVNGPKKSVLSGNVYERTIVLEAYGADALQVC